MENKIFVEMTIDELNAFKEFKEKETDVSTQVIINLLKNRCATLKEETGINPNTMENINSSYGTIYLDDDSKLYFCYTRKVDKYEH